MESPTQCAAEASAQYLADLEAERPRMVQTMLQIRARCQSANSPTGTEDAAGLRQLLAAAVRDLEEMDERLQQARAHQQPPRRPLPARL